MSSPVYKLTVEQIASVTDAELAFSTDKLLPEWEQIPDEFKRGNVYTKLVEALMFNRPLPNTQMVLNEGVTSENLNRCVRAHLQSFGPKHEHKIAGVGYMISLACTIEAGNS